jgi:signal transduction histidine kinase
MLASLPVRLIPGEMPAAAGDSSGPLSPIVLSLAVAWGCVLLAAAAVAALLLGVIRLSQRRASFVSAVTHELRTPLTTFQMYSEMLAEGMVTDPGQQREYLGTLRAESQRLAHLVENVLAYARLERGRTTGRLEAVALDQLIGRIAERLAGRAAQAGMELVVQSGVVRQTVVLANVSAVEQILLNLVDNACNYAAGAADKRIHLALGQDRGAADVSVSDHGPGVSPAARRRLFRSFCKSAREAADSAPGVGLGLALSRRLARDMGGDLRLDEQTSDGARFVLTLCTTNTND